MSNAACKLATAKLPKSTTTLFAIAGSSQIGFPTLVKKSVPSPISL